MKKIILIICFIFLLFGCKIRENNEQKPSISKSNPNQLEFNVGFMSPVTLIVVTVDKCEYIIISGNPSTGGMSIIHKANCRNH